MNSRRCAATGAIILAMSSGCCGSASAQQHAMWALCANDRMAPHQRIAGCTLVIDARMDNESKLAVAHNNRGFAYLETENNDKALADFSARGWLQLHAKSVLILDRDRLARRAR